MTVKTSDAEGQLRPFATPEDRPQHTAYFVQQIINISTKTRSARFNQIMKQATTFTYTRIHHHIHLRQRTIPPHITQLSSAGMTDQLTMNPRHRNERLTVLLAASNKQRHSCPGHRCFENSSLISWTRVGQCYLSSVIYYLFIYFIRLLDY